MKRIAVIFTLSLALYLSGCGADIPKGFIEKNENFERDTIQDSVDFCVYKYDSADGFKNNKEYIQVSESDIENITGFFENFRGWIEQDKQRNNKYSFDDSIISAGDFFRLVTKEGEKIAGGAYGKYDNYTLYFFDLESQTLYYIHANI